MIYSFTKKHMELLNRFLHHYAQRADKSLHFAKKTGSKQCIYLESSPSNLMYHTKIFNPSQPPGTLYWPNFSGSLFLLGNFAIFLECCQDLEVSRHQDLYIPTWSLCQMYEPLIAMGQDLPRRVCFMNPCFRKAFFP